MAQVVIIEGPSAGTVVPLKIRSRIGSAPESEIRIDTPEVRPFHALLSFEAGGYRIVPEPGATVKVNARPAIPSNLHHGDLITVGSSTLLFSDETHRPPDVMPKKFDLGATVESRVRHFADPEDALIAIKRSERLSRHIETLYRLGASTLTLRDLNTLLDTIIDTLQTLFRPDRVFIYLHDPQKGLQVKHQRVSERSRLKGSVRVSQTILNETLQRREAFLTRDASQESGFDSARSIVEQDIHAAMCVPLVKSDHILGVLYLDTLSSATTYTEEELHLMNAVGTQAALAIENVLHFERQTEHARKLMNLAATTRRISSFLSQEVVILEAVESAAKMLECSKCSVLLFDEKAGELRIASSKHLDPGLWNSIRIRPGEGVCGKAFTHNEPLHVIDASTLPETVSSRYLTNSFIIVPILSRREGIQAQPKPVGLITASDRTDQRVFDSEDVEFLSVFATQLGIALNNARLFERATVDTLTRVATRSFFFTQVEEEAAEHLEHQRPFSVCMLDIDHFKKINDTYGHDMGDATLVRLGALLKKHLLPHGAVGRYGGEEFIVFLRGTQGDRAVGLIDRFRQAVAAEPFGTAEQPIPCTISAGVCSHVAGMPLEAQVKRADVALYRAKTGGRNRVVLAGELDDTKRSVTS